MKKIITLLMLCIISIGAFAYNGGTLKIRDAEGGIIMVNINGKKFPKNGRILTVSDVPPGLNRIKIYRLGAFGRRQNMQMIYSGSIKVQPNFIYRCTVDDYEGMDVQSYCCINNNGYYSDNQNYNENGYNTYNDNDQDWNDNYWGNSNNGWIKGGGHHGMHHDDHDYQGGTGYSNGYNNGMSNYNNGGNNGYKNGNGNNGYNNGNGYIKGGNNGYNGGNNGYNNGGNFNNNNNGMSPQAFQSFKQTVENSSFDSGKQTIVKTQLQNMWITSGQLKEIIEIFSFESSKIDMAKYGAARVIDKQNLFNIYNCFSFESSKTEFANYLATLK